jgi:hypothetical protein
MAGDGRMTARAQQCTEAIMNHLKEYIAIRFDHAIRINPRLRTVKEDLLYHEMENVRACLMADKIYGVTRLVVSLVLMGDDEKKRRGLMSPTDQTSIQVELVSHVREEVKQATRGQIKVHDLKSYYSAIDPVLTDMMDLIETWIWWDIYDASELARFEQKLGLIQLVRQGRATADLRRHYGALLGPATDTSADAPPVEVTVSDEEIVQYELQKLVLIRDQWKTRRQYDHGYMFVLQRDPLPAADQGDLIHRVAERIREYDRIEHAEQIDEDIQHAYGPLLKLAPAKVTREAILEHLQASLVLVEREMLESADADKRLGPPYRYKVRQVEMMEKWLRDLAGQIKSPESKPAEPQP